MNKKTIYQHDENDCGAACLSMIAEYYGYYNDLRFFRSITKTDQEGVNLYGISKGAETIGLKADCLQGNFSELCEELQKNNISFPFVAHVITIEGYLHYIVVDDIRKDKIIIRDPARGKIKVSISEFEETWTGHIVAFSCEDNFEKGNYRTSLFQNVWELIIDEKRKMFFVLAMSILISIIGITGGFVFEIIIDSYYDKVEYELHSEELDSELEHEHNENNDNYIIGDLKKVFLFISENITFEQINIMFMVVFFMYILGCALQYIRGKVLTYVQRNIDMRLGGNYLSQILDMPISESEKYKTGEYLARFTDISLIRYAVSTGTTTIILDSMMVIFCGVILFISERRLFILASAFIVAYILVAMVFKYPIENRNRKEMEADAVTQSYLKESIDGIMTVKSCRSEERVTKIFLTKYANYVQKKFENSSMIILHDTICMCIELISQILILGVGFSFVIKGEMTIGALVTFFYLRNYFTEPIKECISLQPSIQSAIVAFERLCDVIQVHEDVVDDALRSKKKNIGEINRIDIVNLSFGYGNRANVLHNVSMSLKKGEKIAIVGESGSGKTTLAKIIAGYYPCDGTSIRINNNDIDECMEIYKEKIMYVDQNIFLFSGTIIDNLKMGAQDISEEEISRVCKICGVDEFVSKLSNGYEQKIYENGADLSGGQRQRIAIARALLCKPSVLILDEATSHLDTITEKTIQQDILNYSNDITFIIIAHRLSTIKKCDRVYVMENGNIIEQGNHDELVKKNGKYHELWSLQ